MKQRKGGGDEGTGRLETGRDGKTEEREAPVVGRHIHVCVGPSN